MLPNTVKLALLPKVQGSVLTCARMRAHTHTHGGVLVGTLEKNCQEMFSV